MINDVIIIGGGSAGLCAAVYLKQNNPSLSVRILEALPRVGKKLGTTGNGRCNITNKSITLDRYHGENVEFCRFALEKYDNAFCEDFFLKIGVPFIYEGDKGYPSCLQAASVVDCLRFAAEELGVTLNLETKVQNIQTMKQGFRVIADNLSFDCRNLIIAAGLLSGGERMGCDGSLLELLKKAGFKTVMPTPAIVQLKTETETVKQLKGIKIDAKATVKANGKALRSDFGEVLFCDYGLSGPPILQLSRAVSLNKNCEICLDLMPDTDFYELLSILTARKNTLKARRLEEFFTGMLNKRLGQVILKLAGCRLGDTAEGLTEQKLKKTASLIKGLSFKVLGTTGFSSSQVTAGGLKTLQFFDKTMESRDYKGLFAVGEILDIDGDCGGFNLKWAWSSAFCAADKILKGEN